MRAAVLTIAIGLLGAPVGILWAVLAPRADIIRFPNGNLGLDEVEDGAFIATDGIFFFLTFGVGVLLGLVAWVIGKNWSVGALLGGAAGAALAAGVALQTGQLFDERLGTFAGRDRSVAEGVPLTLPNALLPDSSHPWLLILGWPAGFALGFAVIAYLRSGPATSVDLSSGRRSPAGSRVWVRHSARAAGPSPDAAPPVHDAADCTHLAQPAEPDVRRPRATWSRRRGD